MKKNCNGCKAFISRSNNMRSWCSLGYSLQENRVKAGPYMGLSMGGIPIEDCPKPKTNAEYMTAPKKIFKKD